MSLIKFAIFSLLTMSLQTSCWIVMAGEWKSEWIEDYCFDHGITLKEYRLNKLRKKIQALREEKTNQLERKLSKSRIFATTLRKKKIKNAQKTITTNLPSVAKIYTKLYKPTLPKKIVRHINQPRK